MKLRIYSVYDVAIQQFHQPFFCRSDLEAQRMILDSMNEGSKLYQHPGDFSVHFHGEFDTDEGTMSTCEPMTLMNSSRLIDHVKTLKVTMPQQQSLIPTDNGDDNV